MHLSVSLFHFMFLYVFVSSFFHIFHLICSKLKRNEFADFFFIFSSVSYTWVMNLSLNAAQMSVVWCSCIEKIQCCWYHSSSKKSLLVAHRKSKTTWYTYYFVFGPRSLIFFFYKNEITFFERKEKGSTLYEKSCQLSVHIQNVSQFIF